MLNWIRRLLTRPTGRASRRQGLEETIHVSKVLSDTVGRRQHLASLRGTRPFIAARYRPRFAPAERGAVSAVRRALLNAGQLDGLPVREGSHAWPVTRDQLRLLARHLEDRAT
jgi:hypothetical protein